MPLIISGNDLCWNETIDKIKIIVSFKSRVDSKLSILTTSRYLKVSSPPWFCECFLASAVNVSQCFARIGDNQVSFELKKELLGLWNKLEDENKDCKMFRKEQRQLAFEEHRKKLELTQETNASKKSDIHKESVRRQMLLDDRERKLIEREKKAVNERVTSEIQEQFQANERALKMKHKHQKSQDIPPPRKSGLISVTFTPRVFPTAARESQEPQEKEWLQKQAAATISLELDTEDLSPQEKNPQWLKEKAEFLFNKKDYRGAVNAYSLAVRMCPKMYSLYLGRCACHLQLRNLHKCIEDSSKALELLQPPVSSNEKERLEAHKIRATAFCQLDLPLEGLMDYEAALKIDASDEELKSNADVLRNLIQTHALED